MIIVYQKNTEEEDSIEDNVDSSIKGVEDYIKMTKKG